MGVLDDEASTLFLNDNKKKILNVGATHPPWLAEQVNDAMWIKIAGDKNPKQAVLRAAPAAVEFISKCLVDGKQMLILAEPENMDIAAAILLTALIACFSMSEDQEWKLQWLGPCEFIHSKIDNKKSLIPAIEKQNSFFTRVTVRQYLAVLNVYYPQIVLGKSLLKQIYNVFLPDSMTVPTD